MRAWGLILWLFPLAAFGRDLTVPGEGTEDKLAYYVSLYSSVGNPSKESADLTAFVSKLEQKQSSFKNTVDFL
jgi:hypothetical protein